MGEAFSFFEKSAFFFPLTECRLEWHVKSLLFANLLHSLTSPGLGVLSSTLEAGGAGAFGGTTQLHRCFSLRQSPCILGKHGPCSTSWFCLSCLLPTVLSAVLEISIGELASCPGTQVHLTPTPFQMKLPCSRYLTGHRGTSLITSPGTETCSKLSTFINHLLCA